MKNFVGKSILSVSLISILAVGATYADTLELPPSPSSIGSSTVDGSYPNPSDTNTSTDTNTTTDSNATLDVPPSPDGNGDSTLVDGFPSDVNASSDSNTTGEDNTTTGGDYNNATGDNTGGDVYTSCEYGQYYSVLQNSCVAINPLSKSEMTTGVWLDVVVDKSTQPPTPTGQYSGCHTIEANGYDLNVTNLFKAEDNTTLKTESSTYAYYDETSGMLSMQFSSGMDSGTATSGTGTDTYYDEVYITQEGNYTFLLTRDYYSDSFFISGLIQNDTTHTCSDLGNSLVFENDYFNPNLDKPIQVSGYITLPDEIDPHSVSVQAMTENYNWISQSNLDTVNGNQFTLGFDTAQNVAIQVNFGTANDYYQYFYTSSGWQRADWSQQISDYVMNIDHNMSGLDLNVSAIFASQVKVDGNISYENGTSVNVEFINMNNGQYFGWQELRDGNEQFSAALPSTQIGDKYVMRVNLNAPDRWESYFVDFRDGTPKLIPDNNINWNSYIKDSAGNFQKVNNDGEWQEGQVWLPDFNQTGYLELKDTNTDGTITKDDLPAITLSFLSDALDSQFYIIEGNVTVPSSFTPSSTNYYSANSDNVNFEVLNKDTGNWITSTSIETTDLDSNSTTNTYKYKIKLDKPTNGATSKEFLLRVNYQLNSGTAPEYQGYFIGNDGSLTSDRNIPYTPVLTDYDGNPLEANSKTNDQCNNDGNFWWQAPGSTQGTCYDGYPSYWVPDTTQVGTVIVSDAAPKKIVNVDFVTLANNIYKISGEIVVDPSFVPSLDWNNRKMIMVEAVNADTGMFLGSVNISENAVAGKANTYAYSLTLPDAKAGDKIIVRLMKDETSSDGTYNNTNRANYIVFNNDNNLSDISLVSEDAIKYVEKQGTDGYSYWVPDTDYITLGETKSLDVSINLPQAEAEKNANRLAVSGVITLKDAVTLGQTSDYMWNSVRVELINTNSGEWINSRDAQCASGNSCSELSFDMDLPSDGNYTVKVVKDINGAHEEYYYNFGADHDVNGTDTNVDKIVNGQKVEWVEAQEFPSWGGNFKNWMPDPSKTGWLDTTSAASKQTVINIDFNAYESSQIIFSGTITVPYDFEVGSLCTNGTTTTVKRCSWEEPLNEGYNTWYGSKNLRIEAMNAQTGDYIASIDLRSKTANTNNYLFKLVIGDTAKDVIIKINKESNKDSQWKSDEIYYNFGSDHAYTGIEAAIDGEKLVNGKKVPYVESNTTNQYGYKNWMPDVSKTGYAALTSSVTNFNADISQLGVNDLKIKGKVTFKSDFNISNQNSFANINVIDASSGFYIANTPINDDGTYELNLGEEQGEYVLQVNYSYNDYNNWQNSWYKNKYYDFGTDKAYGTTGDTSTADAVMNESDVRWVPKLGTPISGITSDSTCWQAGNFWDYESGNNAQCYPQPDAWVPNVNGVNVTATINDVNIDLSAVIGNTLNIEVTNFPTNAKNRYVMVVSPTTNANIWQNIDGNSTTLTEVKDGNYTIEFGYDLNGQYKHFFMSGNNDSAVSGDEVRWTDIGNGVWGPNPEDTTYLGLSEDTNISITIPAVVSNTLNVTLTGIEDAKNVSAEFKSLSKPYGKWEQNTSVGTEVGFKFEEIKNGNFILSLNYEGNNYVYDDASTTSPKTLKKDPEWVAKDANGTIVCGGSAGYDCNWDNSYNWTWLPNVTPLNISAVTTDLTVQLPTTLKVSGTIDLTSDFAGKNAFINIFQQNGTDWNGGSYQLDSNGDYNGSIKVSGGSNYRIEVWIDGLGGYVYTTDLNDDSTANDPGWIAQMKSWDTTTWQPKVATLVNITSNMTLPTMNVGSDFKTVVVSVENLDTTDGNISEDVWVSLESDTLGYYGDGNANWDVYPATHDKNITLKVPAGDYNLLVFPMNHKGGYLSDNSGGDNTVAIATATFSKIGWTEKDKFTVDTDEVITVSLPLLADLKEINGTVICKDTNTTDGLDKNDVGANCEGWIDAWSGTTGKGTIVNRDGTFNIKGLDAASYELTYSSFDPSFNGLTLSKSNVDVSANSVNGVILKPETTNTVSAISGTVTKTAGTDNSSYYVVLIEVTDANTWKVISTKTLDANGNFEFGARTKPSGKSLVVAVASRTFVNGASTIQFDNSAVEVFDESNIDLPSLGTDLADTFSISIN